MTLYPSEPQDDLTPHELVDGTLYVEGDGIIGRCTCGWNTGKRFSSFTASAAFQDHLENVASKARSWETER